jgi:uncharacterized membrane protein YdjX (TVP38/TMEM64 family)
VRGLRRLVARGKAASAPPPPGSAAGSRLSTILRRGRDVLIIVGLVVAMRSLSHLDFLQSGRLQEIIQGLGAAGPLAFVSLCVVTTITFIPPLLPIGFGSIAFGHGRGGALSLVGISLGACAAYLLGRHAGAGFVSRLQGRRAELIGRWIARTDTFACMVSLRLVVFCDPTFNYLTGATRRITPRVYALGTFLGLVPRTFMLSYFFDLFMKSSLRDALTNPVVLAFPLVRVAGVLLFAVLIKRPARDIV